MRFLPPEDLWQCLEISVLITTVRECPDLDQLEAKDAAEHPAMHRMGPHNKVSYSPKCQHCQGCETLPYPVVKCLQGHLEM